MQLEELYLNQESRASFFKWLVQHADAERAALTVEFRKADGTLRRLNTSPTLRHAYKAKADPRRAPRDPDLIALVDVDIFDAYRLGGLSFDAALGRAFRTVNANRVERITYNDKFAWNFI